MLGVGPACPAVVRLGGPACSAGWRGVSGAAAAAGGWRPAGARPVRAGPAVQAGFGGGCWVRVPVPPPGGSTRPGPPPRAAGPPARGPAGSCSTACLLALRRLPRLALALRGLRRVRRWSCSSVASPGTSTATASSAPSATFIGDFLPSILEGFAACEGTWCSGCWRSLSSCRAEFAVKLAFMNHEISFVIPAWHCTVGSPLREKNP